MVEHLLRAHPEWVTTLPYPTLTKPSYLPTYLPCVANTAPDRVVEDPCIASVRMRADLISCVH